MKNDSLSVSASDYAGTHIGRQIMGHSYSSEQQELIKAFETEDYASTLLQKAFEEIFEKGKAANMGEERDWNGKTYVKTANGWRPKAKGTRKRKEEKKEDSDVSPEEAKAVKDFAKKIRKIIKEHDNDPEEVDLSYYDMAIEEVLEKVNNPKLNQKFFDEAISKIEKEFQPQSSQEDEKQSSEKQEDEQPSDKKEEESKSALDHKQLMKKYNKAPSLADYKVGAQLFSRHYYNSDTKDDEESRMFTITKIQPSAEGMNTVLHLKNEKTGKELLVSVRTNDMDKSWSVAKSSPEKSPYKVDSTITDLQSKVNSLGDNSANKKLADRMIDMLKNIDMDDKDRKEFTAKIQQTYNKILEQGE